MIFYYASDYHMQSACKRYTIDKAFLPSGYRYTAWRRTKGYPINLGCFDNAALAKAQCEQYELTGAELCESK